MLFLLRRQRMIEFGIIRVQWHTQADQHQVRCFIGGIVSTMAIMQTGAAETPFGIGNKFTRCRRISQYLRMKSGIR